MRDSGHDLARLDITVIAVCVLQEMQMTTTSEFIVEFLGRF